MAPPQSTGQKDRNGKEILDGDVGLCYNLLDDVGRPRRVTVFQEKKSWYVLSDDGWKTGLIGDGPYGIDVIGNINDLPPPPPDEVS